MSDSEELSKDMVMTNEQIIFDHKLIISLCNKLIKLLDSGNHKTASINVIDTILKFAKKHFQYEESLMFIYNYSFSEEHKEEHRKLLFDLEEIKFELSNDNLSTSLTLAIEHRTYLVNHIKEMDKLLEGDNHKEGHNHDDIY